MADLDGEAGLDLIVAHKDSRDPDVAVSLYLQSRAPDLDDGVPPGRVDIRSNIRSVRAGDLDGDGDLDAVAIASSNQELVIPEQIRPGSLAVVDRFSLMGCEAGNPFLVDLDADGVSEIILHDGQPRVAIVSRGEGGQVGEIRKINIPVPGGSLRDLTGMEMRISW